jgi:HD-GYP domain-containing protein (c-di-GMP phosphodiesterase class II)
MRLDIRRNLLAVVYLVAGVLAIAVALRLGVLPPKSGWPVFGMFAFTHAVFEWRSTEINDRMLMSSAVMVAFSAAMYFSIQSGFAPGAVVPSTLIVASGALTSGDIGERRIARPVFNFGQMAVTGLCAGWVIDTIAGPGFSARVAQLLHEPAPLSLTLRSELFTPVVVVGVAGLVAATASTLVSAAAVRLAVTVLYGRQHLQPWSQISYVLGAQVVQGIVGAFLGAVLATEGSGALIPLALVVFLIGNMVFSSLGELRIAQESALSGFVKTLEARDLYTRGHTERVAEFTRLIGEQLHFSGTQLEQMRWAALIHDVGKLAVPTEIMRKQGLLNDDEYRDLRIATHKVDDLLSEVDFLAPMVDICSGIHPRLAHEDFGQRYHRHSTTPSVEQSVLAVADAFDAMISTRTYRMAMSQSTALHRLESSSDRLFLPEVVSALRRGLEKSGARFGPPEIDRTAPDLDREPMRG